MAKRLSVEEWAMARALWETDPILTFEAIGKRFGVSKQAVQKRSKDGKWERKPDAMSRLVERAHAKADRMMKDEMPEAPEISPEQAKADTIDKRVDEIVGVAHSVVDPERDAVRAAILKRHRDETSGPRKLAYQAPIGRD